MVNLSQGKISRLARALLNDVNPHGVPYFKGYADHVEHLIRMVQVEIAKKN